MTRERQGPPPRPRGAAQRPPARVTPPEATEAVVREGMTLERLGRGLAEVLAQLGTLTFRLDRIAGRQDEIADMLAGLRLALPAVERWCKPWLSNEGEVYCEGGYKLMRAPGSRDDPHAKEWTHPLPPEFTGYSWNERSEKWVEAHWHNVYESQAARQPPPEGERPWPEQYAPAEEVDDAPPF